MPFQPVPNAIGITINQVFGNISIVNTMAARVTSGPIDGVLLSGVAQAVFTAWRDGVMPNLSTSLQLVNVLARDLTAETGASVPNPPAAAVPGGLAGDPASPTLALVLTLRTGTGGRTGRGRMYIGGLVEGQMSANVLAAVNATSISNGVRGVRTAINTIPNLRHCIISRFFFGTQRPSGATRDVTAIEVRSNELGTQRSRLRRP